MSTVRLPEELGLNTVLKTLRKSQPDYLQRYATLSKFVNWFAVSAMVHSRPSSLIVTFALI